MLTITHFMVTTTIVMVTVMYYAYHYSRYGYHYYRYGYRYVLYTNIDQTFVSSLHGLLNCEIGGLDGYVITT